MNINCLLFLITALTQPFLAECVCGVFMPYSSMTYLDQTQLTRYGLTDPCTVTCTTGYTGEFCQNQVPFFTNLPMGPWNQAGYYTSGNGLLRTMSINVADVYYLQYTKKDSILVGIGGMYSSSGTKVVEIALYSGVVTTVLLPPTGGSLNCLLVRKGVVYVARTKQVGYDVVAMTSAFTTRPIVNTPARAFIIEVFVDKGTVTSFVYLAGDTINACYPDGTCPVWATKNGINGLVCGADCPSVLYASFSDQILRVTSAGFTTLARTGSLIYCLTSVSAFNVLLYKSTTTMYQYNLQAQTSATIPLGITETGITTCSSDVSEQNNQILIVQNGVVRTLEAVQIICGFGLTSQPLVAVSQSTCTPCPTPPVNAYWIEGSATCEWECLADFIEVGSKCIASTVQPCPQFYVNDPEAPGTCKPSLMPWVERGKFVDTVQYSASYVLPGGSLPYPTTAVSASVLVETSLGVFYMSSDYGVIWTEIHVNSFTGTCPYSTENRYYYLNSEGGGVLWVAFFIPGSYPVQHCLWMVDTTTISLTNSITIKQAWSLGGKLCCATGDNSNAYVLLCGTHFLSVTQVKAGFTTSLAPLTGSAQSGYADGTLLASLYLNPSSMVLYDQRLYVTDTGNSVIRELDLLRNTVKTVAGTAKLCERTDDGGILKGLLSSPANLTYTQYDGFFAFVDIYAGGATIRQFHVPTCTVQTIKAMPWSYFNDIVVVGGNVIARKQGLIQLLFATPAPCPAGSSSLPGGALSVAGCISCGSGFYSDAAGSCKECSLLFCNQPGKLLVPCQLDADAYCGTCTNKPAGNTVYVGPSSITGTSSGGGDCAWAYTPPCPKGYYASSGLCVNCPAWSSTAAAGSTSLNQCTCLGNGAWKDGICVVPASLDIFPLLPSCSAYTVDSPDGICPCEAGEYIEQINPKVCTICQAGTYSATGTACTSCPDKTEPSLDRTTCRCAGGLHDASDLTALMPQCECGPGKAFLKSPLQCKNCAENTFNAAVIGSLSTATLSTCQSCAQGTFSGSGASVCSQCPFGTYRVANSPLGCQSCPTGMYASDPTYTSCVACSEACDNGAKESQCPTDPNRLICSECSASPRSNSHFNGGRDCATSCDLGYYERDTECVACTVYDQSSCTNGSRHVPCGVYTDAACVPCVNSSMPLNYAVWKYSPLLPAGPNAVCEWTCEPGYVATQTPLPEGVPSAWECVLAGAWNVWDLFTI